MSKSEDNESLDFEPSEKPYKKFGSKEHAQDEMEQRKRQARGLKKQSCTIVLRGLYPFVVEPILFCSCLFCLHWIHVDRKEQNNNFFIKTYPCSWVSWPVSQHLATAKSLHLHLLCTLCGRRKSWILVTVLPVPHGTSMAHPLCCSPHLFSHEKWIRSAGITSIFL